MLIASLSVGDTLITLTSVQSLDRNDPMRLTYNMAFTDGPTGHSYTKSFTNEALALYALAGWIVADNVSMAATGLKLLESDPAMRDAKNPAKSFLP